MGVYKKIKPLEKIDYIGKRGGKEPFSVLRRRGLYFYLEVKQIDQLKKINNRYKSIYKRGVKPLEALKLVGRGSVMGYKPFLLPRRKGRYLCVSAEHLKKLEEINAAYTKFLEKEKIERKRKRANKAILRVKECVGGAQKAEASKYVPKEMQELEASCEKINRMFNVEEYDNVIRLAPKVKDLAQKVAQKALKKVPQRKYLYGIIPAIKGGRDFGNTGVENARVYTMNYKDLDAVVSDTQVKEYAVEEKTGKDHENVVRRLTKDYSVVPAAFGQVFKNKKIMRVVIKKAHKALSKSMHAVRNRVELGVKAVMPKEIGECADEQAKEKLKREGEVIWRELKEKAASSIKGKLFTDRLVLNASFLVDKDKQKEFSKKVERLGKEYKNLKLRYSGPWAPYSFTTIKIGKQGIEIGKEAK